MRTAVIVSADAGRRIEWGNHFAGDTRRVVRCVGPTVSCALLAGEPTCPLLDAAELAVYDRDSIVPDFVPLLLDRHPSLLLLFATDDPVQDGHHPLVVAASTPAPPPESVRLGETRIIPPPPRAVSEEEAEQEIREMERRRH